MISVIICSHNPKHAILERVLEALKTQTLPLSDWELIIVDNLSNTPIVEQINLGWHTNARIVVEPELGKVNASLCGINEAKGELLVFVDDDNVLSRDYLKIAKQIADERPYLGAFGGSQIGEFTKQPDSNSTRYLELIAVRKIEEIRIANSYEWDNTPPGAGLVIRKQVGEHYYKTIKSDPNRVNLDRKGKSLMSSGDIDLAYTSLDLGYLNGLFPELNLLHVIPENRLSLDYLKSLQKYNVISNHILEYVRFKKWPTGITFSRYVRRQIINLLNLNYFEFEMERARRVGFLAGIKWCLQIRELSKRRVE
jgi:glycosyltransferase involved in cell wall biosynthesis